MPATTSDGLKVHRRLVAVRPQEGLLHDVVGQRTVADDGEGEAVDRRSMGIDRGAQERGVGLVEPAPADLTGGVGRSGGDDRLGRFRVGGRGAARPVRGGDRTSAGAVEGVDTGPSAARPRP